MTDDNKKTVYHYTTREGAAAIEESGVIKESSRGLGGQGVYVTTLPPSSSDESILRNNYDNNFAKETDPKNVECHVKMCMDEDKLHQIPAGDHDVLLHKGDINCSEQDCKIVCKNK